MPISFRMRLQRVRTTDDGGSALILTVLALLAILGLVLSVTVPVIANSSSVNHTRSVADVRRLGDEVLGELFAQVRDQRSTVPTFAATGRVDPTVALPANPWAMWNAAHTDFVTCSGVANPCFFYAVKLDQGAPSATVRTVVAEVTVRTGCSTVDTCTYRRFQQTWNRRLLTDYLMVADSDSSAADTVTYIEGQPATQPTTADSQALVAGYWRNTTASAWTVANVDRGVPEDLWQTGSTVTEAVTKSANSTVAPKGAIRVMTQLTLNAVGNYTITASSPDEGGQLRVIPRPNTPTFDVPRPDVSLPASGGSASVTAITGPTTVLVDFIALNNNANKVSVAKPLTLQITPPGGSATDIAATNTVAMKATFDTANRSGAWWFEGMIHINQDQWASCGRLDMYDDVEAGATSGSVVRSGRSACTPSTRSLDQSNATAATSFARSAPTVLLPTTSDLAELETTAQAGGLQVIGAGSRILVRSNHLDVWTLPASGAPTSYPLPTNSVTWVRGALEISTDPAAGAHDITFLADGDITVVGDVVGSNIGLVTKTNFNVAATEYKRTIDASILALGKAGNAAASPTPWLIGLPKLELWGSIAARTPYQNVNSTGAYLPQFKLPTPPWTPPYFPQAHNAHWERVSLTELPVTKGLAPAPA